MILHLKAVIGFEVGGGCRRRSYPVEDTFENCEKSYGKIWEVTALVKLYVYWSYWIIGVLLTYRRGNPSNFVIPAVI